LGFLFQKCSHCGKSKFFFQIGSGFLCSECAKIKVCKECGKEDTWIDRTSDNPKDLCLDCGKKYRKKKLRHEDIIPSNLRTPEMKITDLPIKVHAPKVEGKETWEYAKKDKDDLVVMKKCCDAELEAIKKPSFVPYVPAPFYFERVAILSRKEKNYKQEIYYCEKYIKAIDKLFKQKAYRNTADARKSPRYKAIIKRLPKAKELLEKKL